MSQNNNYNSSLTYSFPVRQFNLHRAKSAAIHVQDISKDFDSFIFLMQEHYIHPKTGRPAFLDSKHGIIAEDYSRA